MVQDIEAMFEAGKRRWPIFISTFETPKRQQTRPARPSLFPSYRTFASLGSRCDLLSDLYMAHHRGKKQPSGTALAECSKKMLTLLDQFSTYLIIEALDESPNTSGIPSPRERVLHLLKELVEPFLPNLHICVTSRPEIDICGVFEPLASRRVSLHDQYGKGQEPRR